MFRFGTLVALSACLAACVGSGGDPHALHFDAAAPDPVDDAGTTTHRDSGTAHRDAGQTHVDAGHGSTADAGTPLPGPGDCSSDIVSPPTAAACSAATLDCLYACTDDTCVQGCLTADPTCGDCLDQADVSCANANGCQAAWDPLSCCIDSCPDPESDACQTACATEGAAYDACAMGVTACDSAEDVCFPPGSFDPGAGG